MHSSILEGSRLQSRRCAERFRGVLQSEAQGQLDGVMPCTFVQGLLYILQSHDHHTCAGSDIMTSRQDTYVTSRMTSSPTRLNVIELVIN